MNSASHDLFFIAPLITLVGGALAILLVEAFRAGDWSRGFFTGMVLVAAAVFSLLAVPDLQGGQTILHGLLYADPFSFFTWVLVILGALLALLLSIEWLGFQGVDAKGEFYALFLFSISGALLFVAAAEMVTLFVGLEIMSMALYCLCGSSLRTKSSSESALKYFLLGSFSSAFLLYGIALLYGLTGSTEIAGLSHAVGGVHSPVVYFALGLVLVGLIFKIGAVPFHFWAPDVYQGAPTSVTAFMACVIKVAAFAAAMRVLWVAFEAVTPVWEGAVWTMAVLTMTVGNVVALRQRNVKRMLAYSSIAHAGYLMVGFLAPSGHFGSGAAMMYYLVAYTLMTMGAFGVVLVMGPVVPPSGFGAGRGQETAGCDITHFNGLGSTRPLLAGLMTLFLLSLAGIPPGFAGFVGKFYLFGAAIKAGWVGIVIIGVLNSAISCYYYLRVVVAMYFLEADGEVPRARMGLPLAGALSLCAVGILVFGLFPSAVYESAAIVMQSLHEP